MRSIRPSAALRKRSNRSFKIRSSSPNQSGPVLCGRHLTGSWSGRYSRRHARRPSVDRGSHVSRDACLSQPGRRVEVAHPLPEQPTPPRGRRSARARSGHQAQARASTERAASRALHAVAARGHRCRRLPAGGTASLCGPSNGVGNQAELQWTLRDADEVRPGQPSFRPRRSSADLGDRGIDRTTVCSCPRRGLKRPHAQTAAPLLDWHAL
jgi:hypothetical protein